MQSLDKFGLFQYFRSRQYNRSVLNDVSGEKSKRASARRRPLAPPAGLIESRAFIFMACRINTRQGRRYLALRYCPIYWRRSEKESATNPSGGQHEICMPRPSYNFTEFHWLASDSCSTDQYTTPKRPEMNPPQLKLQPPDGGWGWMIIIATCINLVISIVAWIFFWCDSIAIVQKPCGINWMDVSAFGMDGWRLVTDIGHSINIDQISLFF